MTCTLHMCIKVISLKFHTDSTNCHFFPFFFVIFPYRIRFTGNRSTKIARKICKMKENSIEGTHPSSLCVNAVQKNNRLEKIVRKKRFFFVDFYEFAVQQFSEHSFWGGACANCACKHFLFRILIHATHSICFLFLHYLCGF